MAGQKQSKSIKAKVAGGYFLLICLLFFSMWLVYQETKELAEPDAYEAELDAKRQMMSNTLAKLYQAEVIGQSLSVGRLNDYPTYRRAMRNALASIDSLKTLVSDSVQMQRIDSISMLLERKGQNMLSLLRAMNDTAAVGIYRKNIEQIISQQDSLLSEERVQKKIVVKERSYQVPKKKKGFFKRLAEAFAPGKQDTATVTDTSREYTTDTLVQAYNPADTVAVILRNIQIQISDRQQERSELLRNKANNLRYNGQILTTKINQILRDFEEEEVSRSLAKLDQARKVRQHSVRTIAGIAIVSAFLAILFLVLIWRDITGSNRYRKELEVAKQRAEDLLASREKLMLTITHDIKAPIGSIIGYTDLLMRLTTENRQRFYLNNMRVSSEHLLKLVGNLLDFHKLDSNKVEINRVTFNPYQLFDEIRVSFEPLAEKKNLRLVYRITPELNGRFISDPFRIRQVTDNLLSNAVKFTEKGDVCLAVSYQDSRLTLTVKDTGRGIPQEEKEKIFQEFTRLKNAQGEEGFGLGLSIVQKLVVLLEGDIEVDSVPGEGSSFTVRLPLFPVAGGSTEPEEKETEEIPVPARKRRVLLIDDDRIQLELTVAMLKQLGAEAVCCQHPDELFAYLEHETFDLLLTDMQMPALNGLDLLVRLRASDIPQAREIPVAVVTARSDMGEEDLRAKGFARCLHKPFSMNELKKVLSLPPDCIDTDIKEPAGPEKPELNFGALTLFSEDDKDAARDILCSFITETKKNRAVLTEAVIASDAARITELAHKILPLFRMINALSCIDLLAWLEAHRGETFGGEMKDNTLAVLERMEEVIAQAEEYAGGL